MAIEAVDGINEKVSVNGFSKVISAMSKVIDPLSRIGGYIGSAALAIIMFLTLFDVLGRFIGGIPFIYNNTEFFKPIPGALELTENLMLILIAFALGYCAMKKGHIRVDVILHFLPVKANKWIDVLTYASSCFLYVYMTWYAWKNAVSLVKNETVTFTLNIPIYPFAYILMVGTAIIALVLFRDFLESVNEAVK